MDRFIVFLLLSLGLISGAKRLDTYGGHHEVRKFADVVEGQHELAQFRPGAEQGELDSDPDIVDFDLLLILLCRLSNVRIQCFLDVTKHYISSLS